MKIEKLEPANWMQKSDFWHLIKDEGRYFLFVSCENSFVSYDLLFEMDAKEKTELIHLGWIYAQYLAARVNSYSNEYMERRIEGRLKEDIDQLIHDMLKTDNHNTRPNLLRRSGQGDSV